MNTPLNTFPAPLLRLILCGGGGLAPAWGPLDHIDGESVAWNPLDAVALMDDGAGDPPIRWRPLALPGLWSLPLDAESPWPVRLALVAAYLTWLATTPKIIINPHKFDMIAASVDLDYDEWEQGQVVKLTRFAHRGPVPSAFSWVWSTATGRAWTPGAPYLLAAPALLAQHPPAVALVLALWDVPGIRARIEAP